MAVTGTSGKTSVADFTRQIFAALGRKAASLGTIGLVKSDGSVYGSLTTPDPVALHRTLSELAAEGVTHLAFEASSHGLDQHRLDGVRLTAAAFTNLGRDHLDYHPDMESTPPAGLFSDLLPRPAPPVNADVAEAGRGGCREKPWCRHHERRAGRETLRLEELPPTVRAAHADCHGGKVHDEAAAARCLPGV